MLLYVDNALVISDNIVLQDMFRINRDQKSVINIQEHIIPVGLSNGFLGLTHPNIRGGKTRGKSKMGHAFAEMISEVMSDRFSSLTGSSDQGNLANILESKFYPTYYIVFL